MKVVTDYLFSLIAKQVEDWGLVVWYDPERAYTQGLDELTLPKTTIARYTDSFFRLRHEIDHLLNDGQPPRLVVYVPMLRGDTHGALIELRSRWSHHAPRPATPESEHKAGGRCPKPPQADPRRRSSRRDRKAGGDRQAVVGRPKNASFRVLFMIETTGLLNKWREPTSAGLTALLRHKLAGGQIAIRIARSACGNWSR